MRCGLATGEFVALLDHDDELAPARALFRRLELNHNPGLQLLYSDEDKLDPQGRRCDPTSNLTGIPIFSPRRITFRI